MRLKIDEKTYFELITQSLYLQALEAGGVDNWTWYSTAIQDFIQMAIDEDPHMEEYFRLLGKITEDGLLDDIDIECLAQYYLDIAKENQNLENVEGIIEYCSERSKWEEENAST